MHDVLLHDRARRFYERLDRRRRRQINKALDSLRDDPFAAPGVAPLHGEMAGLHRLRAGGFRIVFEVRRDERRVFVLAIGPRGDIYK